MWNFAFDWKSEGSAPGDIQYFPATIHSPSISAILLWGSPGVAAFIQASFSSCSSFVISGGLAPVPALGSLPPASCEKTRPAVQPSPRSDTTAAATHGLRMEPPFPGAPLRARLRGGNLHQALGSRRLCDPARRGPALFDGRLRDRSRPGADRIDDPAHEDGELRPIERSRQDVVTRGRGCGDRLARVGVPQQDGREAREPAAQDPGPPAAPHAWARRLRHEDAHGPLPGGDEPHGLLGPGEAEDPVPQILEGPPDGRE